MFHFTTFVKWASVALIASMLALERRSRTRTRAAGERAASQLRAVLHARRPHRACRRSTNGRVSEPIHASTSKASVASVHWFAYDWAGRKMYVVYSSDASGTLMLGVTELHAWHIAPIGPLTPVSDDQDAPLNTFGFLRGLAYSQVTGRLYTHARDNGSGAWGVITIQPETGVMTIDQDFRYFLDFEGGLFQTALTNDTGGNLCRAPSNDAGPGAAHEEIFVGQYAEGEQFFRFSGAEIVAPKSGPNFDGAPAGYDFIFWGTVHALGVHPENQALYAVLFPSWWDGGLGILKTLPKANLGAWQIATMNPVIDAHFPMPASNVAPSAGSLVFVPWEPTTGN